MSKTNRGESELAARPGSEKIPDEIPDGDVVNRQIDSIKKRRSSLRRSVNGGFSSTLRALSAGASSLPPDAKKRRIGELCLNHTLQDYRNAAPEEEQDMVLKVQDMFIKNMQDILQKAETGGLGVALKQETETSKYIKQLKEETVAWNDEYKKRREDFKVARATAKEVQKKVIQIEIARLRPEEDKYIKSLPDFAAINKRIQVYQKRHCLGLISLEKNARRVHHVLAHVEKSLEQAKDAIHPTFSFTSWMS